ncbi:uncharacterized protein LOC143027884 [Oratosquilla oratoria]|uniref:uncharacterized protein LOC143027884 n=1 Tax=Oratosquilla oratoria TaxID=337810 RepID=UPI003F76670C
METKSNVRVWLREKQMVPLVQGLSAFLGPCTPFTIKYTPIRVLRHYFKNTWAKGMQEVKKVGFQLDGIPRTDQLMYILGPFEGTLDIFSICLWYKVYFWRGMDTSLSYAVDTLNDNVIDIAFGPGRILLWLEGLHFVIKKDQQLLRWSHICLVYDSSIVVVYVDGVVVGTKELRVSLRDGGYFVLGQEQDDWGGGYTNEESYSGEVADAQFWKIDLSPTTVKQIAQCLPAYAPENPIVHMERDDWTKINVTTVNVNVRELCQERDMESNFFIYRIPTRYHEAEETCHKINGTIPGQADLRDVLAFLVTYVQKGTLALVKYVLHFTIDSPEMGEECLQRKCGILVSRTRKNGTIHALECDLSCNTISPYIICKLNKNSTFHFRGIEMVGSYRLDNSYIMKNQTYMHGLEFSNIIYNGSHWILYPIFTNNFVIFLPYINFPPVGRKTWSLDNLKVGTREEIDLTMTTCNKLQFTCNYGDCIPLTSRCDAKYDCHDHSDERNCQWVVVEDSIKESVLTNPGQDFPMKSHLTVTSIPIVDVGSNKIMVEYEYSIHWNDSRLSFHNLVKGEIKRLRNEDVGRIWHPRLGITPVLGGEPYMQKFINVLRFCENATHDLTQTWEDDIIPPACTEMQMTLKYKMDMHCIFRLKRFPFDYQFCSFNLTLLTGQHWLLEDVKVDMPVFDSLAYNVTLAYYHAHNETLEVTFYLVRQYSSFVVTTFLPNCLILMIAYLTFNFEYDDFTNRVMVTLSGLIVVASLFAQITSALPTTSYSKCIDFWFLIIIVQISTIFLMHTLIAIFNNLLPADDIKPIQVSPLNGPDESSFKFPSGRRRYNVLGTITACIINVALFIFFVFNCI